MANNDLKENKIAESRSRLSPAKLALLERRLKAEETSSSTHTLIPPREEENYVQLSYSQQRMWFLNRLEPDSPFYNVSMSVEIKGSLNVGILRQAANEVVRRHEVLRTGFIVVNGSPVQVISEELRVAFPVIDLEALQSHAREQESWRLINEEVRRVFDLSEPPLLCLRLFRLDETTHVASLVMHHIISDGWSMGLFVRELASIYETRSAKRQSSLKDLPVQYADYAVWQRKWLEGSELQRHLSYWKKKLSDAPPVLQLPTDRPRPAVQTYKGASYPINMTMELSRAIKEVGQRERVSTFMLLLAGLMVLLHRYTQERDLVIGAPFANRTLPEIEGLIGFFVNTLVLRTQLGNELSAREAIERVRDTVLDAHSNGDMPFEKLVEDIQPERSLSHTPLFQVMLALDNTSRGRVEIGDLTFDILNSEKGTSIFDLSLLMEESLCLIGSIEYNTDLFDKETIGRVAENYRMLLEDMILNLDKRLSDLELLSPSERHELLNEFKGYDVVYKWSGSTGERFSQQSERTPDAVAVEFEGKQLSYAELNKRANQVASYLIERGAGPDVRIGISLRRGIDLIVAVLGILKSGSAYVPLDPAYPRHRLLYMVTDADCKILLTEQGLAEVFQECAIEKVFIDLHQEEILKQNDADTCCEVFPENIAYIIYTSGSTGEPKGVALTHGGLLNLISWQEENFVLRRGARTLQFTSLSFDVSFQEIFSTLFTGGTLIMISEYVRQDSAELLNHLKLDSVERLFLPFVALQYLAVEAENRGTVPDSLCEVITAGEQLQITPHIRGLFNKLRMALLQNQYGPSESHVVTAFSLELNANDWMALPPIGRPISNTQIYLMDADLQLLPCGVPGELYIGGANLARGYFGKADLTAEKFIPDSCGNHEGARLYRTGDNAKYLRDGNIEFLGRVDHQVKIRGYRIELREVETEIEKCPSVKQAVVVVREDQSADKRLVAYVVKNSGNGLAASEIKDIIKEKLPGYMIPSVIMALDTLPLTASGKVDREALPPPEIQREEQVIMPRTPTEGKLAVILAELLGIEKVGINENFFDMGGHSLLATQLITRVRETFHVELALKVFFDRPTVAELAEFIDQEIERGAAIQFDEIVRVAR